MRSYVFQEGRNQLSAHHKYGTIAAVDMLMERRIGRIEAFFSF